MMLFRLSILCEWVVKWLCGRLLLIISILWWVCVSISVVDRLVKLLLMIMVLNVMGIFSSMVG